jgi:hypothetical protein
VHGILGSDLLENAEQESTGYQTTVVSCETSAGHYDSPDGNDKADPIRRALEEKHDGICRDLANDVGYEEDHVGDVVVGSGHLEVLFQAFNFGVANVGSV